MNTNLFVSCGVCGGLVALLLRRLWRVHAVASAHRKRRRRPRAWVELASMWHTPLLVLAISIVIARAAFFVEIFLRRDSQAAASSQRWRLWIWLELPSALVAIATAYLIFFHAHVALYRVWSIRWDSTALVFRLLLIGFSLLLFGVVVLLAYGREMKDSELTPTEWTRLTRAYFAVVWILLGAELLKFTGQSADVMWTERELGRLLVISPRGLHALVATETVLSLVLILRGAVAGVLVATMAKDAESESPMSSCDLSKFHVSRFVTFYGVWELLAVGALYRLCGCVPVVSRARRLVGYDDSPPSQDARPLCGAQPVLRFELLSPKQAVEGYWRSATVLLQNQNRHSRQEFNESGVYEPTSDMDDDAEDGLLLGSGSFDEPLLDTYEDEQDASYAHRRGLYGPLSPT